jgi:hypothetical protein
MKKSREQKITTLAIILIGLILVLASSCAAPIPMKSRSDFYVSEITSEGISCTKQRCELLISNTELQLTSNTHNLVINRFQDITYHHALGHDQNNTSWYVTISNMKREPYFMLLQSPTTSIILGSQCYQ